MGSYRLKKQPCFVANSRFSRLQRGCCRAQGCGAEDQGVLLPGLSGGADGATAWHSELWGDLEALGSRGISAVMSSFTRISKLFIEGVLCGCERAIIHLGVVWGYKRGFQDWDAALKQSNEFCCS